MFFKPICIAVDDKSTATPATKDWNCTYHVQKRSIAMCRITKWIDILPTLIKRHETIGDHGCKVTSVPQSFYKTFIVVGLLGLLGAVFTPAYASNIILGPPGVGPEHWISASDPLSYEIRFENDPSATAPVQVLTITQTLDSDLDFETFSLGGYGFAENTYGVTGNLATYTTRINFTDYSVDFLAGINVATGIVTWTFTTIDPATGEVPSDLLVGFLPVNNEGFVSYSVLPRSTVVTGDTINAEARIVFDNNDPIDTPTIYNTINVTSVPEPATFLLLVPALFGLLGYKRKRS
jgi:hypothetical protein